MKKTFIVILILFSILFLFFVCSIGVYLFKQKHNGKMISYCSENDSKACYVQMFELLLPELVIYNIQKDNQELALVKFSRTPAWVPHIALQTVETFLILHNKPLYIPIDIILQEWNTEIFEYELSPSKLQNDSQDEFWKQLNKLKSSNKKAFIQLDVLDLDNEFCEKVMEYSDIITGFLVFLHIENANNIIESQKILKTIEEKYVLTSRNSYYNDLSIPKLISTRYYKGLVYDSTLALSFVNKNSIDNYQISPQQNTDKIYRGEKVHGHRSIHKIPKGDIHWTVTVTETVKQKYKQWTKQL